MPSSYVVLWTLERCRWLQQARDSGPLEVVFGGPHTSLPSLSAVSVGDIIYPVCVQSGALVIIAGMTVHRLLSPEDYLRSRLGIVLPPAMLWDEQFQKLKASQPSLGHRLPVTCADLAAVSDSGSEIRFDRQVPGELLASLRLGPTPGREQPLKGVRDGQLRSNLSLHGHVRRLSSESADLFASVLGPVLSPFPPHMRNPGFRPSTDPEGFDREKLHEQLPGEILDFLDRTLKS